MESRGLDDLIILVVNDYRDLDYCDDVEDYSLPVLLDVDEDGDETGDVMTLWDAAFYDLFILDRGGDIAFAQTHLFPADDQEVLIEALSEL